MAQKWDPISDLVGLQDRMNRLFEDVASRQARGDADTGSEIERADWLPAADVYEDEKEYTLDLPGMERDTLDIGLENDRLTVRGVRSAEDEGKTSTERPYGRFFRKFTVPSIVDQQNISADYKDGVLKIRLPKRKEEKARRVEIRVK